MNVELLIASKRTGKIWDISNSTKEITWTTSRTGTPGVLKFSVQKAGDLSFTEGDVVRFSQDGELQFYGWVFTKEKDRWDNIDVTCYDRLRYLKANASYAFYAQSAADIIKQIAEDMQVSTDALSDPGYKIPSLIEEDQCCLDIIGKAVQQTLLNTGKVYVFYDSGNGLSLTAADDMKTSIVIGDKSYLGEYTYKTDIDSETYNSVKLARPNESTGRADVYVVQDSDNIKQWGLLQLYQKIDGDMNEAQIMEQANVSLTYYNRRMRTLSCSSIGLRGLRAGQMIAMKIDGLGDIDLDQYMLLEKVSHTYSNDLHTMDFELKAI